MASGCPRAYLLNTGQHAHEKYNTATIEPKRTLPLLMAMQRPLDRVTDEGLKNILGGLQWQVHFVTSPWEDTHHHSDLGCKPRRVAWSLGRMPLSVSLTRPSSVVCDLATLCLSYSRDLQHHLPTGDESSETQINCPSLPIWRAVKLNFNTLFLGFPVKAVKVIRKSWGVCGTCP